MKGGRAGPVLAVLLSVAAGGCATGHFLTPPATLEAVAADAPGHGGKPVAFSGRVFEAEADGGVVRFLVAVDGAQLVAYCEYPREDGGVETGAPVTLLGFVREAVPRPLPLPGTTPDFAVQVVAVEVAGEPPTHLEAHDGLYHRWTEGGVADTALTP